MMKILKQPMSHSLHRMDTEKVEAIWYSQPASRKGQPHQQSSWFMKTAGLTHMLKMWPAAVRKRVFVALAPDALHPVGGYPGNDDEGRALQRELERSKIEQDFVAAARYLNSHALSSGKTGVVGFCFGGYISNYLAAAIPDVIDAAVPYYGTPAATELVGNVRCPILGQLAEIDERVNTAWDPYEEVLKANNVPHTIHIYPGTRHGFHNDSTGRFDKEQADISWDRTIAFFNEHLS